MGEQQLHSGDSMSKSLTGEYFCTDTPTGIRERDSEKGEIGTHC